MLTSMTITCRCTKTNLRPANGFGFTFSYPQTALHKKFMQCNTSTPSYVLCLNVTLHCNDS